MKKSLTLLCGCVLLSACVGHETNLQANQEERDALLYQKRAQEGCQFVRDQDAYRECLLNTYYSTHPATYDTAELVNGKSIAIVKEKATYQQGIVPQVAPLPATHAQILSYTETTSVAPEYYAQQGQRQVVQARGQVLPPPPMIEQPRPQVVPSPMEQGQMIISEEIYSQQIPVMAEPAPAQLPIVQVSNNQIQPAPVVPVVAAPKTQEQTWWQNYQENRQVVSNKPGCPCADPNDPCPQCYEK